VSGSLANIAAQRCGKNCAGFTKKQACRAFPRHPVSAKGWLRKAGVSGNDQGQMDDCLITLFKTTKMQATIKY
jgi:hypothetical protein